MRTGSLIVLIAILTNYAFSGLYGAGPVRYPESPPSAGRSDLLRATTSALYAPGIIGLYGSRSNHYAPTPTRSLATFGTTFDSSYLGSWRRVADSVSIYKDGMLMRQAILYPIDTLVMPRDRYLPEMELRLYSYDAANRVKQIRMLNHVFYGYFIEVSDELTDFNYDDSGRVSNVVSMFAFRGSDWTPWRRMVYSYSEGSRLQSVQMESFDGTKWSFSHRTSFVYYPNTLADSLVFGPWEVDRWLDDDTVQYVKSNSDTLLIRNGRGSHTVTLVFDPARKSLRYSKETTPFNGVKISVYNYDQDGILLNVDSHSYNNEQEYEHLTYGGSARKGPSIFLLSPHGGYKNFDLDTNEIRFLGTGESLVNLEYAREGSNVWTTFASNLADTGIGEYLWVPGKGLGNVKIRAVAGSVQSEKDGEVSLLPGHQYLTQSTGNIQCGIFSTGFIGQDWQSPYPSGPYGDPGFRYKGNANALFSGGPIVGRAGEPLFGNMSSFWSRMFYLKNALADFASDAAFDQRTTCTVSQGPPMSLEVTQRTASRTRDDFIFLTYDLKNLTTDALSQLYIGLFADWDINDPKANVGGIDSARSLAYEYSQAGPDHNYYGIVALSGMSGAAVTGAPPDLTYLQSLQVPKGNAGGDLRTFIGSGPFSIDRGGTQSVAFALLAAPSLEGLRATADSARALWKGVASSVATTPSEDRPRQFSLAQNYPNPFNPSTKIRFNLADNVWTTLKVFNVLGEEVRTLVNEVRKPGNYEVTFDANFLPSGVYFYKLEAGTFRETKRFVLIR